MDRLARCNACLIGAHYDHVGRWAPGAVCMCHGECVPPAKTLHVYGKPRVGVRDPKGLKQGRHDMTSWAVTRRMLAAAVAALVAVSAAAGPCDASPAPCPLFMAHRGLTTDPEADTENGRLALAQALADPDIRYAEADARPTRYGYAVINHDATWDRTSQNTTGATTAHGLGWAQANVRLRDGTHPLSMGEWLAIVKASGKRGFLEIKGDNNLVKVAATLNAAAAGKAVRLQGTYTTLKALKKLAPSYPYEVIARSDADYTALAKAVGDRILIANTATRWFAGYFASGLGVDFFTDGPAGDAIAARYRFGMVLTGDVARTKATLGCG
jgi:glycerophosphoryl diester phosphodiesterase